MNAFSAGTDVKMLMDYDVLLWLLISWNELAWKAMHELLASTTNDVAKNAFYSILLVTCGHKEIKWEIDKWMSWIIQFEYFYVYHHHLDTKKETIGRVYRKKNLIRWRKRTFSDDDDDEELLLAINCQRGAHKCAWNWIKSCKWRKWYVNFFSLNYSPYACYPNIQHQFNQKWKFLVWLILIVAMKKKKF